MPIQRPLKSLINKHFKTKLGQASTSLELWFNSHLGKSMLAQQKVLLERALPRYFGYHLVYSGYCDLGSLLEKSPIGHQVKLGSYSDIPQLKADINNLPFDSDSIDVVLLQHVLDVEKDPFQILREASRVILPNGNLLLIGFNPWSLWGFKRALWFRFSRQPWMNRFISPYRLSEWLDVLGFDLVSYESASFLPFTFGVGDKPIMKFLESLAYICLPKRGGFYLLVAKKRVSCITPLRLKKSHRRRRVVPVAAAGHVIKRVGQEK